jgi:hypothetical protein
LEIGDWTPMHRDLRFTLGWRGYAVTHTFWILDSGFGILD